MAASRPRCSTAFAVLSLAGVALSCSTGNFVPNTGTNSLYYIDTTSIANFAFQTYYFGADCNQHLQTTIFAPDGSSIDCELVTEPGDNQVGWTFCQPMDTFVNGQYQIDFFSNVQQFNQFRVTTSQSTVTITPTTTVTDTPTAYQIVTSTSTITETDTSTPPAVTLPASTAIMTITPSRVTTTTTVTKTKTRTRLAHTVKPTVVYVAPKCKHDKPPRCKPIKGSGHPHAARHPFPSDMELGAAVVEDVAEVEKRYADLEKRLNTVSTLQDPTTTITESTFVSTVVVEAPTTTSTETDTAFSTSTVWTTLPPQTVYTGVSVAVTTLPTKTKTITRHTIATTYVTKTRTYTYTIISTQKPSPAQITSCMKAGGHY